MPHYELLLAASSLARPRQFHLRSTAELDGTALGGVLEPYFPGVRWYLGMEPLTEAGRLAPGKTLVLTDIPRPPAVPADAALGLKLFVAEGRDAGAQLELCPGVHPIGRGAPLWLTDPTVSRTQARVTVDDYGVQLAPAEPRATQRGEAITLRQGSQIKLGGTVLEVGDPLTGDGQGTPSPADLEFARPPAPELGRMIGMCLAALVPILSGLVLVVLTGSYLFLAISGLSAMLGLFPAGQCVRERHRWKRAAVKETQRVLHARTRYAAPLGVSVIADLERLRRGLLGGALPPLVWGQGWCEVPDGVTARRRNPGRTDRGPARGNRGTHRLAPVPVYAPACTGTWQIVGHDSRACSELLSAVLARFLPYIASGRLPLVIDPSLTQLPAELMLLPHVRQSEETSQAAPSAPVPAAIPRRAPGQVEPGETAQSLVLTGQIPQPVPGALVIGMSPCRGEGLDGWIDPHAGQASLPDPTMHLDAATQLSPERLIRLVHQCLAATDVPVAPDTIEPGEPDATEGPFALLGTDVGRRSHRIHLDVDGPHILVCGTTGSGKSEALRRIVADLAARYDPLTVAFALVDFKGGAGLSVFARLPHVQLVASDLDTASAQRTLAQLEHEVLRRERLLAVTGCGDAAEYCKRGDGPPLPRLIVVIDEFRVFAEALPGATERIDRLATVGRSLGIHLLLSTQRVTGALSGQTRANVNTVIALRVSTDAESMDLVGSTAAAHLAGPGSALRSSAGHPAEPLDCALAFQPTPSGVVAERGPGDLRLSVLGSFGPGETAVNAEALHTLVNALRQRWRGITPLASPFAPDLPGPDDRLPGTGSEPPAEDWCGVIDNLEAGTHDPLHVPGSFSQGLLICGVPESGARLLLEHLSAQRRLLLCIGSTPAAGAPTANLSSVDGSNSYELAEALEFLDGAAGWLDATVYVHSVDRLQSQLHPLLFQRLDEVLCSLVRRAGSVAARLVIAVDRDQNMLKAAGLCAAQCYFPLNSTEALRMSWPKLPPTSQQPGRGVLIGPEGTPQVVQLMSRTGSNLSDAGSTPGWGQLMESRTAQPTAGYLIGASIFAARPYALHEAGPTYLICPRTEDRLAAARALSERWGCDALHGTDQLEAWLTTMEAAAPPAPTPAICIELAGTANPELGALLQRCTHCCTRLALFVPPTARLAYELGAAGWNLDERRVVILEPEHSQDVQPLGWAPLPRRNESSGSSAKHIWRALVHVDGRVHAITIPH